MADSSLPQDLELDILRGRVQLPPAFVASRPPQPPPHAEPSQQGFPPPPPPGAQQSRGALPIPRARLEIPQIPVTADGTPLSRTGLAFPPALSEAAAPQQGAAEQGAAAQQGASGASGGEAGGRRAGAGDNGSLRGRSASAVTLDEWQGNDDGHEGGCSARSSCPETETAGRWFCLSSSLTDAAECLRAPVPSLSAEERLAPSPEPDATEQARARSGDGGGDGAEASGTPDRSVRRSTSQKRMQQAGAGDAAVSTPMSKAIAKSAAAFQQNPDEREAERVYLKNVVAKLCCTDDWVTQDRLLPVLQALLGFTPVEMKQIESARLGFAPLSEQFYAFTKPRTSITS